MSSYKCPHCEYYMWEGKEFYECEFQNKVSELQQENAELKDENARLKSCLQEIKAIAEKYDNLTYPVSSIVLSHEILQKITKGANQ